MSATLSERSEDFVNRRAASLILIAAAISAILYGVLTALGDLRQSLPLLLAVQGALSLLMLGAWLLVWRSGKGLAVAVAAALAFRIIAAFSSPSLSDDVYRYVWDGRVQLHGVHPYRYAPTDPALDELRDADWVRINHPELETIYPPVAQMLFAALAAVGAGPLGFKIVLGLADFGVVAALYLLLGRLKLPLDRSILYAWNPLAISETAGNGHLEPVGVLLVLLATSWIIERRDNLSTLALGLAIQVKLLPLLLVPAFVRRVNPIAVVVLVAAVVVPLLPYALTGPAVGAGLFDYAERWEFNAFFYAGVEGVMERLDTGNRLKPYVDWLSGRFPDAPLPWAFVYRHVWPSDMARLFVAALVGGWALLLARRAERDLAWECFLVLGALVLFSPTVHPWYVLWVLPFAAAYLSWGWLLFGATVTLAYLSGQGDVPWAIRWIEYAPVLALLFWSWLGGGGAERAARKLGLKRW